MRNPQRLLSILAIGAALTSCAPSEGIGATPQNVVIPGDWMPPDSILAIAATQRVPVVDPPTVLPRGHCTSLDPWEGTCTHPECTRAHPGTTALDIYVRTRWPFVGAGGTYSCRRNSNPHATQNLSVHSIGRAIDMMIPTIGGDADNTRGDEVANWLISHAEYIGIQRVIWDGRFWNGQHGFTDIPDDTNSSGGYITDHHRNHIHVELSLDGAFERTQFFSVGPPVDTCPEVCYGTAVVAMDCSYVDCAPMGQVCLDGPPHCGMGAPPEPMDATLVASAPLPAVTTVAGLSRFTFVGPNRVFDTRNATESTRLVRSDGSTGVIGGAVTGTVTDFPGLPAGSTGVWLGVATVPVTAAGFLNAVPAGTTSNTSTVNFAPPRVRANATLLPLGTGNGLTFSSNVDVNVVADIAGALGPSGLGLQAAGPLRVIDTRSDGGPLAGGTPLSVDVRAPGGAMGVVASVTIVGQTADGFVVAYPCGATMPATSNLNFAAGSVSTTTVVSAIGGDGHVCFFANTSADLIVDITGYFVSEGELSYQALQPARLLDTRTPGTRYEGRLGAQQTIELPIQSLPGMPADVHAVVVNLVSISPGSRGYLSVYPCGGELPATAALNFDSDDPTAALVVSSIGGGSLCIFANQRTHVVLDVLGAWVPTPAAAPPMDGPGPTGSETPDTMDMPTDPPIDNDASVTVYPDGAIVVMYPDGATVPFDGGPTFTIDDAGEGTEGDGSPSTTRRDGGAGAGGHGGCSCRVGATGHGGAWVLGVLGLVITARRARRRR